MDLYDFLWRSMTNNGDRVTSFVTSPKPLWYSASNLFAVSFHEMELKLFSILNNLLLEK